MRKKIMKTTAGIMAAAIMLTACGGMAETEETASGTVGSEEAVKNSIVVAMDTDITNMDPVKQNDAASAVLLSHAYNRLMKNGDDGELVFDLAESYVIENDGLDYVFHIKEGACFSDGTPVTAEDVKFTYDRARNSALTKSKVAMIEEVFAEDEDTVRIRLSEVHAPFLHKTADTALSILSKEYVEEVESSGERYGDIGSFLGSGPFVPTEWVPNSYYTMVQNEKYWGDKPTGNRIDVRVIPDENSRIFALEAGEVDIVWNVDAAHCSSIEENPEYTLLSQPSTSIEFLGMNVESGPFSDVRVRKAINMAVDRQEIMDVVLEGQGMAANSYLNANVAGWTDEVTAYEYDIEGAKRLLEEAGYSEGFSCTLVANGDDRIRSAMLIQNQLADIGIQVTVETWDKGTMTDMLSNGTADLYMYGVNNTSLDPDAVVYSLFHSENHGVAGNYTNMKNLELDLMIEDARTEMNEEKRMEIYKEIQMELKEFSPWVPLYYENTNVAVNAELEDFKLQADGLHWLGDAQYNE